MLNIIVQPATPKAASESWITRPAGADTEVRILDDQTGTEFSIFCTMAVLELNPASRVALTGARSRGLRVEGDDSGDAFLTAIYSRFHQEI